MARNDWVARSSPIVTQPCCVALHLCGALTSARSDHEHLELSQVLEQRSVLIGV